MSPNFIPGLLPPKDDEGPDVFHPIIEADLPTTFQMELDELPVHLRRHLTPGDADFVLPIVRQAILDIRGYDCAIQIPGGACDPAVGSSLICIQVVECHDEDRVAVRGVFERAAQALVTADPFRTTTIDRARSWLGLPYMTLLDRIRHASSKH